MRKLVQPTGQNGMRAGVRHLRVTADPAAVRAPLDRVLAAGQQVLQPTTVSRNAAGMPTISPSRTSVGRVRPRGPSAVLRKIFASEPQGSWYTLLQRQVALTDAVLIFVAVTAAQLGRFGQDELEHLELGERQIDYHIVGVFIAVVWFLLLSLNDTRKRRLLGAGLEEYRRVFNATFACFGILAVMSYFGAFEFSRLYFIVALPVGLGLLMAGRLVWRARLNKVRRNGRAMTRTIVVGGPAEVAAAVEEMRRHTDAGYRPVAVALTTEPPRDDSVLPEMPRVSLDELRVAASDPRLGAVLIAGSMAREAIKRLAWDLEGGSSELLLISQLTDVSGPRIHHSPVDGLSVMHVDLPRFSGVAHVVKRSMDIAFASLALILLSPLYLAISVAIKLEDRGPVFFAQERVGLNGTTFRMHKFRSMCIDAESRLTALEALSEGNGVMFKMQDDPRVTRVGKVLRRYSLDEFPQFWDVLRGQMSVVGPRPPLATEVAEYEQHVHRRLLAKPGVTGLWQVSGRSDLSWEETVRLDLRYVENWSVSGDLVLILKTVRAVLRPDGAY